VLNCSDSSASSTPAATVAVKRRTGGKGPSAAVALDPDELDPDRDITRPTNRDTTHPSFLYGVKNLDAKKWSTAHTAQRGVRF
jgi:hypothetical protein